MTAIIPTVETTPLIDPPPHRDCPAPPDPESALVAAVRAGPSGLGTSATRLARELTLASDPRPPYLERLWGEGTAAPLYVPAVERVDDALAAEVDDRLVVWAKDCGFTDDQANLMRRAGFSRLAMLTLSCPWSTPPPSNGTSFRSRRSPCTGTPDVTPRCAAPRSARLTARPRPPGTARTASREPQEAGVASESQADGVVFSCPGSDGHAAPVIVMPERGQVWLVFPGATKTTVAITARKTPV